MKTTNWEKIRDGVKKYLFIMDYFLTHEDFSDKEFQRKFKGFYRVRRNQYFCDVYFDLLKKYKDNKDVDFREVLEKLYAVSNRIEASFTSKLLATINPDMPVWDSEVLKHIGSELEVAESGDRFSDADNKYRAMVSYYKRLLSEKATEERIKEFDQIVPGCAITNIKKIDFILWQTR